MEERYSHREPSARPGVLHLQNPEALMTRYFFHLREGEKLTKDTDGVLLPHLEGAIDTAKLRAQSLVDDAARSGRSILWGTEYEVEDENGRLALVLPLSHFVEVAQAA
jgi:hypothetical protein